MRLPKIKLNPRNLNANKSWLMLGLAVVLGVGGVYIANSFIKGKIQAYEAKMKAQNKTVKVVVPTRDLPRGYRIAARDLAVRDIPSEFVHKGTVTPDKYKVAEGQLLSYQADKGKPLLWAHLESGSVPTFSGKLPEGKRALTITVNKINSISGFLQPKDKIDLILTFKPYKKKIIMPLLQDVLVLATDTRVRTEKLDTHNGRKSESYSTITLLVTQEEAKKIILAQDAGKLTAVLRHPDDKKILPRDTMSVASLLRTEIKTPQRKSRGIEWIIGGI